MGILLITLLSLLYPQNEDKVAINVPVYHDFNIDQYLGIWYEYARLDHNFERDLDSVYVEYKKDGKNSIKICNKGYNNKYLIWKTFEGRIKVTESPNKLKVSFIPLVWSSFEILYYDCDYKYAIVTTGNSNVLWLMSRTKNIPEKQLELMIELAEKAGFDTSKLIFQNQFEKKPGISQNSNDFMKHYDGILPFFHAPRNASMFSVQYEEMKKMEYTKKKWAFDYDPNLCPFSS